MQSINQPQLSEPVQQVTESQDAHATIKIELACAKPDEQNQNNSSSVLGKRLASDRILVKSQASKRPKRQQLS